MVLFGETLVTRTKFIPPVARRTHLARERLFARLSAAGDEAALTLVVAGAGYGKSTLLSGFLSTTATPALWYELSERDADPQVFLLHLAHLCHRHWSGVADRALGLLALPGGAGRHGTAAVEALADALLDAITAPTWLVLDDFHTLTNAPGVLSLVNHLVAHRPQHLHIALASRTRPDLPDLPRWRLEGEVVTLDQAALAFAPEELASLWRDVHGLVLAASDVARLESETEGWPMAAQLLAGRLREDPTGVLASAAPGGSLRDLFDYWAREVLDRLSEDERAFLLETAPLTRLEPAVCEALTGRAGAGRTLGVLNERGLFLVPLDAGSYRHHHLFREFLLDRLAASDQLKAAHRRAAAAWLTRGEAEEAIVHWLAAGDTAEAARAMAELAPTLVAEGRSERLASWIDALPDALRASYPALAIARGDACRLAARFSEALGWYERAATDAAGLPDDRARALAGQARVALDTLRPALAVAALDEAIALVPPGALRSELLILQAENRLNQGEAAEAEMLFTEAAKGGFAGVPAEQAGRICLRTGRLAEARAVLRATLATAGSDTASSRAHREPALVLAFVEALMGAGDSALSLSEAGLARARRQAAPWAEAVALMRKANALAVLGQPDAAAAIYRESLELAGVVGVARLKAEALMGLALLSGRAGDLAAAEAYAREGITITQETGDAWLSALTSLALGAVFALAADPRAERWLLQAQGAYERCGDPFGLATVALWSARLAMGMNEPRGLLQRSRALLELVKRHDHGFLLSGPSLLGFNDAACARAFAEAAIASGIPAALYAAALGDETAAAWGLGSASDPVIPAAALRVRVLGPFRVWRGQSALDSRAFGREKARALFHLLIVYRGQLVPKARLIDLLWPDLDAAAGDGTFRVALNALNKTLEPDRKSGEPARYIVKSGASYGLLDHPDLWIDASAFERGLDEAALLEAEGHDAVPTYEQALALSEGPLLAEFAYAEPWFERERERLADRYAQGSLRLAKALFAQGDLTNAAAWAQRLIAREPCSEEAYRVLMSAQYQWGDRALALKTYDRLVFALDDELDVDPMPETQQLFNQMSRAEPI